MTRSITLVLLGIFFASIAFLTLLNAMVPDLELAPEIAKAVLQLGLVAIVGSFVSMLVFEYQREKGLIHRYPGQARKPKPSFIGTLTSKRYSHISGKEGGDGCRLGEVYLLSRCNPDRGGANRLSQS